MKLKSLRTKEEQAPVLLYPSVPGPEVVYWVFSDISFKNWKNMTVITPGFYGEEFPKTFGHYHGTPVNETYRVVSGKGLLILQKKQDNLSDNILEVVIIKLKEGDQVIITPEWGHSLTNLGDTPLITFDDWDAGHTDADYQEIKDFCGMAYYITKKGSEMDIVKNKHYNNVPTPKFLTAEEFTQTKIA